MNDTTAASVPEVSVLVVGYKSLSYIERCLCGAIRSAGTAGFEFIFIDCSNDGSEQFVRERFPSVKVLPYQGNLGFALGNNLLATHARGRRLLLLNPDAFAERDELVALLAVAKTRPDAAAWGAVNMLPSGKVDGGSIQPMLGALPIALAIIGLAHIRPGAASLKQMKLQEVPVLSGAFMMVDADLWRRIGGFDERFFMYAEEVDLCKRIADAGYALIVDPRIRILHDTGSGDRRNPQRLMNRARGNATFFRKHFGPTWAACCLWLQFLHAVTRLIGGTLTGKESIAAGFKPIVTQRSAWWNGWPGKKQP